MLRNALLLLAVSIPLAIPLAPAAAAPETRVTAADVAEIHAVINRQIDAFRHDDAQGAFALASPAVQRTFRTPQKFLDVVRMAYRAVYRPAAVAFLDLLILGDEVVQQVQVTDRGGMVWLAYYAMQRQGDGSWRTGGCHLVQPARTIPAALRIE
ncbi:MAG TPA: DUF4864 domain-containing protein [Burkholderiales bacterium]|nr:DUF4864 domain-containing protein [Burkholderiales bacterium]